MSIYTAAKNIRHTERKTEGSGFRRFFIGLLRDIFWAEEVQLGALPFVRDAATSGELKETISMHFKETQRQAWRLERIFEQLGVEASAGKCDTMASLIEETDEIIANTEKGTMTRDAALIVSIQKIEHHEISVYGSLYALAREIELYSIAHLLEQTLTEERNVDAVLNELALAMINARASAE